MVPMQEGRKRIIVDGRVQGVFFRASTARAAQQIGVNGWVRNLQDGRVEAVFEGPAEKIAEAVRWASHGPERAVVTSVEEYSEEPEGLTGFGVR